MLWLLQMERLLLVLWLLLQVMWVLVKLRMLQMLVMIMLHLGVGDMRMGSMQRLVENWIEGAESLSGRRLPCVV